MMTSKVSFDVGMFNDDRSESAPPDGIDFCSLCHIDVRTSTIVVKNYFRTRTPNFDVRLFCEEIQRHW